MSKKNKKFVDPTMPKTESIILGPSEGLESHNPEDVDFNFVLVHRHDEWLLQKWGNLCSKVVTHVVEREVYDLPLRWYHKKIYHFCYEQYDKYGDYYRLLDNSFGTIETDQIREVR